MALAVFQVINKMKKYAKSKSISFTIPLYLQTQLQISEKCIQMTPLNLI
jgi:hypothetical protein